MSTTFEGILKPKYQSHFEERRQLLEQKLGIVTIRIQYLKSMTFVFHLKQLHSSSKSAILHRIVVQYTPLLYIILPCNHHQHLGTPEPGQARSSGPHRVNHWVTRPTYGIRVPELPHIKRQLLVEAHIMLGLPGPSPLRAQEVGMTKVGSFDLDPIGEALSPGPHGQVMGYISPGAVPAYEEGVQIAVVGQPWVWAGLGREPLEGSPAVLVGGGKGVFGGKAVLDTDDEGMGLEGEEVHVSVLEGGEGRVEAEAAFVEVDDDGELLGREGGGEVGEVEPSGDTGLVGDDDIFGSDTGFRVLGGGGDRREGPEAVDGSVLVDTD